MTLCCALCEHYIGAGDFNLCCSKKYGLCYADTPACDLFKLSYKARDIYRAGARAQKEYMETRQPKNNYELLQRMSTEELANLLAWPFLASPPWCLTQGDECPHIDEDPVPCEKCALEWLKQEAAQCDGGG